MKILLATLWLTLLPLWASAQSGTATDELLDALQGVQQLQGDFEQRQYGNNNELLVESRGRFRLLHPGYFAWEILWPDNQLIIASPEFIWHYDQDLESATRRPVTDNAQMSPLQVLGEDASALRRRFSVERAGEGDFVLSPLTDDVGFQQLTLHLNGPLITGMDIMDNLNQRVVIEFSRLDSDSGLTGEDFAFTPPDGIDLFYYDE